MKALTFKQQNLLSEVLGNFDFAKVEKVMSYLDWKWAHSDGQTWVWELVNEAKRLLTAALHDESCLHSAGGFSALYRVDNEGEDLSLKFILENITIDDQDIESELT